MVERLQLAGHRPPNAILNEVNESFFHAIARDRKETTKDVGASKDTTKNLLKARYVQIFLVFVVRMCAME
jgi:hypothetical protein